MGMLKAIEMVNGQERLPCAIVTFVFPYSVAHFRTNPFYRARTHPERERQICASLFLFYVKRPSKSPSSHYIRELTKVHGDKVNLESDPQNNPECHFEYFFF